MVGSIVRVAGVRRGGWRLVTDPVGQLGPDVVLRREFLNEDGSVFEWFDDYLVSEATQQKPGLGCGEWHFSSVSIRKCLRTGDYLGNGISVGESFRYAGCVSRDWFRRATRSDVVLYLREVVGGVASSG